jgi:methyl-accepting chemotaxis protein
MGMSAWRDAWERRFREGLRSGTALLTALACATLLTCGIMMLVLIRQLDVNSAAAEMAAVTAGVDEMLTNKRTSAYNTARWDDAVAHLYGRLDQPWAFSNLSGNDILYVIDAQGRTLFARRSDGTIDPPMRLAAPAATAQLLRLLPHDRAGAARETNGVATIELYRGGPAAFGAMPVTPLQGKARVPSDALRFIVYVTPIEQPLLTKWSARFAMNPITLDAAPERHGIALPLRGAGRPIAWFNWQPKRPGRTALMAIAPTLLAAIAALAALFALLVRLLRSQEQALVARNAQQAALVVESERLRGQAEHALETAERSRQLADEAAERAMREREQHAQALRRAAHEAGQALRSTLAATLPDLVKLADRLDHGTDLAAASTRIQAQHAEDVVRRTTESVRSLEHISLNTDRMAVASASIGGETAKTRAAVSTATDSSSAAAEANASLLHHVATIEEASALIAGVAEQTNLLALNATIEAARAHAQNAGFAVIAREIKTLSQDTQSSAKVINQRVTSVQQAVQDSVGVSRRIDAQLRQILDYIATAADAAAEQAAASGGIRSSVATAREQVVAVDASISQISGAITELAAKCPILTRNQPADARARAAIEQ